MASARRHLDLILSGRSDANLRFTALQSVLRTLGFVLRMKGGHFIYTRPDVEEIVNIQPASGGKAKPYQVKQVRDIIIRYQLGIDRQ